MKYKCTVEIYKCNSGSIHITVKDDNNEMRVYAGKNKVARVVSGVINKFWTKFLDSSHIAEKEG